MDFLIMSSETIEIQAVAGIPAHNEKDFEFAKKYNLEIKQSIAPFFLDKKDEPREDKKTVRRNNILAILLDKRNDKVFVLDWWKWEWKSFVIWWVKNWETNEEAVLREIKEETWYQKIKVVKQIWWEHHTSFFAKHKDINRYWIINSYLVELEDDSYIEPSPEETKNHKWFWINENEVSDFINLDNHKMSWDIYKNWEKAFTGNWVLVNSWEFNDLKSEEAEVKLLEYAEENNFLIKKWELPTSKGVGLNVQAKLSSVNIIFENIIKVKQKINFSWKLYINWITKTNFGNIRFNSEDIIKHFSKKHKRELYYRKYLLATIFLTIQKIKFDNSLFGYFAYKSLVIKVVLWKQSNWTYYVKTYYKHDKLTRLYKKYTS